MAVGHSGGADSVGDEDGSAGAFGLPVEADGDGVDVVAVGDDFGVEVGVVEDDP